MASNFVLRIFFVIHIQVLYKQVFCMSKEKKQVILLDLEELNDLVEKGLRNVFETCLSDYRFGTEFKDEVWTRKDVADFLKTTPENITASFNKKEIPGKKVGREYRFLKSQIVGMFKKGKL